MKKLLVNPKDYEALVRKCYESDVDHISKIHYYSDFGLDACIKNTARDAWIYNVQWYAVKLDGVFIGYFGDESVEGKGWLTGFFIMPEFRTEIAKNEFWDVIVDHFNGEFKAGLYDKNPVAKKFLMKHGCVSDYKVEHPVHKGEVFKFVKEIR